MYNHIKHCLFNATFISLVTLIGIGIGEAREPTKAELNQAAKDAATFLMELKKSHFDIGVKVFQEARQDLETTLQQILDARVSHLKKSIEQSDLTFSVAMKKIKSLERSAKKSLKKLSKEFAKDSLKQIEKIIADYKVPEELMKKTFELKLEILINPKRKLEIEKVFESVMKAGESPMQKIHKRIINYFSELAIKKFNSDLESFEDNTLAGLMPSDEDEKYTFILSGLWLMVSFFMQRLFERIFDNRGYALLTVCAVGFLLAFLTSNYFLLGGSVTGGLMGGAASSQSS
jgi:hypothetical protein